MVLYNAASRARNYGTMINLPTDGGSKKAGFPYMIGRDSWVSIYFRERATFDLDFYRTLPRGYPAGGVNMNLPVGFDKRIPMR